MCNKFRSGSVEIVAGLEIELIAPDSIRRRAKWAGSATKECLDWWLRKPGAELTRTVLPVAEVSETAKDDGELQWCAAPEGAHLLFVLEPSPPGKSYRLAKLVTTAATTSQAAYFRQDRFPLLGTLDENGAIREIQPLPAPPPKPRVQEELF